MVVSFSLGFLYSFLYREYINPIQVLNFPTSLVHDLILARPAFHNFATFVLGPYSTYERAHVAFGLLNLVNST
jgi:hypothetical protein